MPYLQTGTTHCHAQLRLPDKGHAIIGLVVSYAVWLGSLIYGMGLVVVRMAIELKYHSTQQIHNITHTRRPSAVEPALFVYLLGVKTPLWFHKV